jgi:hypothetical protein
MQHVSSHIDLNISERILRYSMIFSTLDDCATLLSILALQTLRYGVLQEYTVSVIPAM